MAIVTTLNKVAINLKLNYGTDDQGDQVTKTVSLSSLNPTAFDESKVMSIVGLLTPCLNFPVLSTNKTENSTMVESE